MKTRFTVDAAHCQRAADELYEMLRAQQRGFILRWYSAGPTRAALKILRVFGVLVSLLGLLLVSALLYFDTRSWATQPSFEFIPVFAAFIAVFVFLPKLTTYVREWSLGRADRRARRHADRALRKARALAPYDADFELKGDLLLYTRGKNNAWQLAGSHSLGKFRAAGLAMQGESITAIFRRPTSLAPSVLILQQGREWTGGVLLETGMPTARHPQVA